MRFVGGLALSKLLWNLSIEINSDVGAEVKPLMNIVQIVVAGAVFVLFYCFANLSFYVYYYFCCFSL